MEPKAPPAALDQSPVCTQIAGAMADGVSGPLEKHCERLRQIEDCRCRLAILHSASKRILFGWQRRILVDVSFHLYRLSRCCLTNCGRPFLHVRRTPETCAHLRGALLLNELQGILNDCARQMEQGESIDQEVGRMGKISRALGHPPGRPIFGDGETRDATQFP